MGVGLLDVFGPCRVLGVRFVDHDHVCIRPPTPRQGLATGDLVQFIINTRYEKFARFNAYLGSQHFHELFSHFPKVTDVVFGHLHQRRTPLKIDNILYHARPLGYPYEWQMVNEFLAKYPQYQIAENLHLRKRYNALRKSSDWQAFRRENLMKEFQSSLTI